MKAVGGILVAVGILLVLASVPSYFLLGKIREPEGWADFLAVVAVGAIVVGIGLKLFLGKRRQTDRAGRA